MANEGAGRSALRALLLKEGVTHIRPGAVVTHDDWSPRCPLCIEDLDAALAEAQEPQPTLLEVLTTLREQGYLGLPPDDALKRVGLSR